MTFDITILLLTLADNQAVCTQDGTRLHIDMPVSVWTPALREAVMQHKTMLLRFLALSTTHVAPAETLLGWCDTYEERAAILEYESGMLRENAERQAWKFLQEHLTSVAGVHLATDDARAR